MSGPTGRLGVAGLGAMGAAMAHRLLDLGHELVVWNRTGARADPLLARGAVVVARPAELGARADTVLVSLAHQAAVEVVLLGPDGLVRGLPDGGIVLDTSTVDPAFAESLARRVAETGRHALDTRVLGNARHARSGELRFLVGGPDDVVERVRPLLDTMAKEVVHLGGSGRGATAKLALNMLMGIELQALAEAVVFAVGAGLPRDSVLRMIAGSGFSSPVMAFKAGVMEREAYRRADFRLDLMLKDMSLVVEQAGRLGLRLDAAEVTQAALSAASGAGLGGLDCAAVLRHLEDKGGRESAE
jgi:3-hydroxyisobutyrate dehydrogenase